MLKNQYSGSLFHICENVHPFKDDKLILQVIEELLLGMKDVHEAGIIHRDLHLGNILIKEGHVVLSDFGLSKDTMINHSLKSTSTPKNSHYFIDPIGLHDFTALDKLSDIYSIGKIIDYITGESELNKKLSFVISKATERNRTKRYAAVDELIQDVNSSVKEISEEEKIKNIEENLQRGEISKDVEEFVMRLMRQEQLSNYIVRKQLYTFWKVLIQFNEIDQLALLGEIDRTYSEATGYGHFENYDLFAMIFFQRGLFAPPPQILVRSIGIPSVFATSKESRSANATPSNTAWVISALVVSIVMPIKVALAFGLLYGERSPIRYGR